ncbi:DNA polymerase beta domain protein region [Halothece sp. PCC 7418]|uniref:nucleotidyltransferase family protein n=1 Tax=Halothece sp. (strain PCC 7418) TaxID=65093 RepID=UPI0002A07C99|nr:nucleotidyltransferase domain-containing protein [Halothece sp. PCC 7418]AFZ43166.1 DNA polymerase beta domain protein region [Halothece sp. PCC 7418]
MSQRLKSRQKIALDVAEKCINLLKQEYRAIDVILFGSLRGDSPWHWDSDLDLAVIGLSRQEIDEAYDKIEEITPDWLKVDLVSLENVSPEVRSRILQKTPMPNDKYLALKSRIEDELVSIERNLERLKLVLQPAETIPEVALVPALSSYINDFYRGCERISESVAVTLDGNLPQGKNWHQALLRQVADVGGEDRPPLWSGSLLLELDEYRKFRHLVLHTYNVELKTERVQELASNLESVFEKIQQAIISFNGWLEEQASNGSKS